MQPPIRPIFPCGMSRSGTTLLTTILDSHPDVSMGYELLPAGLPNLAEARDLVLGAADSGESANDCASRLEAGGHKSLGTFVRRCDRTRVTPTEVAGIFGDLAGEPEKDPDSIEIRSRLSMAVVEVKIRKEGTTSGGFKINAPSVAAFHAVFPEGTFVYIMRDPRDVVASHFANDFDRTIEHITRAWVQYGQRFVDFAAKWPDRAMIVRYEDLVHSPDEKLEAICRHVGLSFCDEVRRFFDSKASVHVTGHRNAENLKRDFFTSSVGRWKRDLDLAQIVETEAACGELMDRFGYRRAPIEAPVPLGKRLHDKQTASLARKKRYFRDEYGQLILPNTEGRVNLTWAEAARGEKAAGQDILILRHDVDHDYETALRMARWEHEHGLRATYCILHTAWYYGTLVGDRMERSKEVLECCLELQELGHEINVHNNFVVLGLKTGLDPLVLLEDELLFMRLHGVKVHGTSTHGDELCRPLDFRNFELFSESVYESRGGRRTITHKGNTVEVGAVSMAEFDLEYEAYDLPRDIYYTDSGGTIRLRENTRGRAGLRRAQMDPPPPYPVIAGILTHPIWWDFLHDAPTARRELRELVASE